MAGKTRPKKAAYKPLSEIFSDAWIAGARLMLSDLEGSGLDKPNRTFSTAAKMLFAYKCLSEVALEYTNPKLRKRILVDAESVCNLLGISLIEHTSISECLTKRHKDCTGAYVNINTKARIICKCRCHTSNNL